jgi:hypothetical protein
MFNTANKTAKAKLNNKNNTYVKDKFVFSFKKYLKPIEAIKNDKKTCIDKKILYIFCKNISTFTFVKALIIIGEKIKIFK